METILQEGLNDSWTRESVVRDWYETTYKECSLGAKVFEDYPLAAIERHMVKVLTWAGKDVYVEDGIFKVKDRETIGVDKDTGARTTGDATADRWEKLIAQGINPFDPDVEAVTKRR